jgi:hypothetical protein
MKCLTVKKVLEIHERSLVESGGDPGVRDQRLLESAVAQPRASFDGKDLYPGHRRQGRGPGVLAGDEPSLRGRKQADRLRGHDDVPE